LILFSAAIAAGAAAGTRRSRTGVPQVTDLRRPDLTGLLLTEIVAGFRAMGARLARSSSGRRP
jgi:hypothetical protein